MMAAEILQPTLASAKLPGLDAPAERITVTPPGPVQVHTTIKYFDDPGVPLVPMVIGGPEKPKPQPKVDFPTAITDVTGREADFSLDRQGFTWVKHRTRLSGFDDAEAIKREHYPEMEELIRDVLSKTKGLPQPSSVHVLTHIMRYSPVEGEPPKGPAGPLYGVHVDQSVGAAEGVARRWLGDRADELLKKPRHQIINIWRALETVTRDPLAVCDARSVPDADLVLVPVQFPDHRTEAVEVKPSPTHRWYFKDAMGPEDVLFFTQVDSYAGRGRGGVEAGVGEGVVDEGAGAGWVPRRVPHCAFRDTRLPEGAGRPRASLELRALVFYDAVE